MDQTIKPRRPRSLRRILFYLALTLFLFVVAAHVFWTLLANSSLNRAIARLHEMGEPTGPQDVHLADVPDARNASLDYKAAGGLIRSETADWKKVADAGTGEFSYPLTDDERPVVRAIIDANASALERIAQARGKLPGGWNDDFSHPNLLLNFDFSSPRRVGRLIALSAINADDEGRDNDAAQFLCDGLALANAEEDRPGLVAHLTALGTEARATETATALAPGWKIGVNGLKPSQIISLLKMLQDESPIDQGDKLAYRTERLATVGTLNDLADGTLTLRAMPSSPFLRYLFKPTLRDDARLSLSYYQDLITATSASNWIAAKRQYPTWFKERIEGNFIFHPGAAMLAPSLENAIRVSFRAKAQRRLACVALATRLYAADHDNRLPDSLTDLVPSYLPAVPIDPMSGGALLYKSDPPRVYSVGDDGIDHGGVPANPRKSSRNQPAADIVVYLTPHPRLYPFESSTVTTRPIGSSVNKLPASVRKRQP